jgi:hypothetical protein
MLLIVYVAGELYRRDMLNIGLLTTFLFYIMALLMNFYILNYSLSNALNVVGASAKLLQYMDEKCKINSEGGIKIENDN